MLDPVTLTADLIACPSVTPRDAGALDVLATALGAIGFAVETFWSGDVPDGPVRNLFASRGAGHPHIAFAGHTDVVPATPDAFHPVVRGDLLHGRGAVDMKGAVAAFTAAAARLPDHRGTISLVITGDEEGPATHGTLALMGWMADRGIRPDLCLVGEPTSEHRLGDTIKIGRRGSVNMWISVAGTQGHVAYPHLADNPVPRLLALLSELQALTLDAGTDWFQPSNLEITDITVGNPATNIIPAAARARLNIRFNDRHRGDALVAQVAGIAAAHGGTVTATVSGEAFLTEPGMLSATVATAIRTVTGLDPVLSTGGGTSDARFLSRLCPVVEFGLLNATMHKTDEAVAIADLHTLTDIYAEILRLTLA